MTPSPTHTSAPNTAVMMVYNHNGQEKCQTKKCSFMSSVFWMMKMSRRPPPTREMIAPLLSRGTVLAVAAGILLDHHDPLVGLWPGTTRPRRPAEHVTCRGLAPVIPTPARPAIPVPLPITADLRLPPRPTSQPSPEHGTKGLGTPVAAAVRPKASAHSRGRWVAPNAAGLGSCMPSPSPPAPAVARDHCRGR